MKQHARLTWITTIILGWCLDFLFWKQAPGVNFAIYVVLCLLGGFLLMTEARHQIAGGAVWLIPPIVLAAVVTFLRAEPFTQGLAVLLTLFLMALLAITFRGGRWLQYNLGDYVMGLLRLVGSAIARPLMFQAEITRERKESHAPSARLNLWPALRGIIIALPILLVFAALLASADLIFGQWMDALVKALRLENLPEYIFRLVYILLAAYALAGVYLHAASESGDERLSGQGAAASPAARFLGFVEAAIVLGSVVVLFGAFVIVQFRYFFGGQANINVVGFTYSEYARRGFGELVAVACFSLLMILGLGAVTRRETALQQRAFSGLSVAIVALVGVMLVSAYQRLSLYEFAYGFSRLRAYVHVFLVWIGLLLAAVVVLELLRRERAFAGAALLAVLGFVFTLSALNVDGLIVRQNVNRSVHGESLDVAYLVSLSTDAIPALVDIFESPNYPTTTREAVGAALACSQRLHPPRSNLGWRSFTVTRWLAANAINRVRQELSDYRLAGSQVAPDIITPSQVVYNCGGNPD